MDDTFYTALAICFRKDIQNSNFTVLNNGITSIKSYIFSDSFHLDKAVIYAAKAAYLAILIKYSKEEIIRFDPKVSLKEYFDRKTAQGKEFGVVLNAIKYKLIQRMFAVVKRGTPFVQLQTYKSNTTIN